METPHVIHSNIIKIHPSSIAVLNDADIRGQIVAGLRKPAGEKSLPSMLVYDERGLRLYDDMTTNVAEYYLFPAEEQILKQHAHDIAQIMHARVGEKIHNKEAIVELGAGSLRKTSYILRAIADMVLADMDTPVTYYALDLQESELERTLKELDGSDIGAILHQKVSLKGLCGTWDDGIAFIKQDGLARDISRHSSVDSHFPLHLMFLGSSLSNFAHDEATNFLRSLPMRPGIDTLLLGLDHTTDPRKVDRAYHDVDGYLDRFILNGLRSAGRTLGDEDLFDINKWVYAGRYNEQKVRQEAFYRSTCTQCIADPCTKEQYNFEADEHVLVTISTKFPESATEQLFEEAKLRVIDRWISAMAHYSLFLLERTNSD